MDCPGKELIARANASSGIFRRAHAAKGGWAGGERHPAASVFAP